MVRIGNRLLKRGGGMKKAFIIATIIVLLSIPASFGLDSVGVMSGYLFATLRYKQNYKVVPVFVSLNFNSQSLFHNAKKFKGDIVFSLEPFINTVYSPDTNVETGINFLARYIFPSKNKLKFYIKGGVGVLYMSQHTREQSTQYNFLPQIGPGVSYFLNEHTSVDFEYRFRHLSNASFKVPNAGINANVFLCGVTHYF